MKYRIINFLLWVLMIIAPFLGIGFLYLFCSFIAWDLDPMHWWLFSSIPGRVITAIFSIIYTIASIAHYEDNI